MPAVMPPAPSGVGAPLFMPMGPPNGVGKPVMAMPQQDPNDQGPQIQPAVMPIESKKYYIKLLPE